MARKLISEQETDYIRLLLEDRDAENKKNGLQRLCKFYRAGYCLRYPHPIRQLLNGLLYDESRKVQRWTLNAIALVGRRGTNLRAIRESIERNGNDPEIMVSAIAALFAICSETEVAQLLKKQEIPLDGALLLAAAQYSEQRRDILATKRVNIDQAEPLELRMATLLIGMGKAPEHLFTLNHENGEVIGELNSHDHDLVAQYSVWAIVENDRLSLSNLSLSSKDIESFPPNVRAWIYRLIVSNDTTASNNLEYIAVGAEDQSDEARDGLATGLRNVFFDGLEETTIDWLTEESNVGKRWSPNLGQLC